MSTQNMSRPADTSALRNLILAMNRRFGRQRLRQFVLGAIPFVGLLALWEANTLFGWLPPVLIPPLGDVVGAIGTLQAGCRGLWAVINADQSCQMTNHMIASIARVVLAAAIGLPMGVAFGILAGMNRTVSRLLEPIGLFANSISGIAWIPLAIVWFGIGWKTTLFIMLNTIFWLLFFNAMLGVYVPGAMPSIITGIRMSMGFGWRALIAAEMIGGTSGLGFMIFASAQEFKMEEVVLGVVVIAIIWFATDKMILEPLERWTIHRWGLVWTPR
ncbi:MAG: ABC transporter permease [Proteobacteria bacterium]|nr:ABC transporter permease [Pseudomonadota bacterium]